MFYETHDDEISFWEIGVVEQGKICNKSKIREIQAGCRRRPCTSMGLYFNALKSKIIGTLKQTYTHK